MTKRLRFFEKDTVNWGTYSKADLYTTINRLNHDNEALWNGNRGAQPEFYSIDSDSALAWKRQVEGNEVVVAVNLGEEALAMELGLDHAYTAEWGGLQPAASISVPAHTAAVWTRSAAE